MNQPKSIAREQLAEQAAEAGEHYERHGAALLSVVLTPEEQLRQRVREDARRDARTRQRVPKKLPGERASFQADYDIEFRDEKRKRAAWRYR